MKKDEVFGNLHASVSTIKLASNTLRVLEEAGQVRLTPDEISRIIRGIAEIEIQTGNMKTTLNKFLVIAKV